MTSGSATTAVTVTASASVAPHDLLVLVLYTSVNCCDALDAGEGWVLLDGGFDGTNNYGFSMWGCISARAGATRNGLTLSSSGNWRAQNYAYRPIAPFRFHLGGRIAGGDWFNATADSRSMSWNPFRGAGNAALFVQGISLLAAGCTNNASVLPTATAPTSHTERFDTGATTAPASNVWLGDKTTVTAGTVDIYSTITNATFWSNTSARTNRACARAFVPVLSGALTGRYVAPRRIGL